ncbi:maturase [Verrucomicrobia bacterium]|nr:maturase [Verrucomicrobiota bacterium]
MKVKTAKDRLIRTAKELGEWLRSNRHLPVAKQHAQLSAKIKGHFQYFGVTFNSKALMNLLAEVRKRWRRCLSQRGGRKYWSWERFDSFLKTFPLPRPLIIHSLYD